MKLALFIVVFGNHVDGYEARTAYTVAGPYVEKTWRDPNIATLRAKRRGWPDAGLVVLDYPTMRIWWSQ